ncbi:RNA polymerase sigma factor [Fimbriiglobus ruber]|uniref:Uncharacterized protein n=1 Tax=Fimbriiglobus ruber TaxID=1908690 RepID=A0A225D6S8_9BACT|nr:RNA polymerase sigma factor [Fimbriiglobus ruber]OWK37300.1 hypothetical protein FRUB_06420 [Fimbriiglobus ruber]
MPEVTANAVGTTAPPDDPVHAALENPANRGRLTAAARAAVRGKSIDVGDVIQEVYKRALESRDRFDPATGSVSTWLNGFVRNVVREKCREVAGSPLSDGGRWDRVVAPEYEDVLNLDEARDLVKRFLSALPAKLHQAVELRYLKEMEYEQIGTMLGISADNARQRVSRGMKQLVELAETEGRS